MAVDQSLAKQGWGRTLDCTLLVLDSKLVERRYAVGAEREDRWMAGLLAPSWACSSRG